MSRIHLSTPAYRIIVGQLEDESTWRELTVQSIFADRVGGEREMVRLKLSPAENSMRTSAAIAFHALKRSGQIAAGTFADFEAGLLDLDVVAEEPVDPTQSAPMPE